MASNKILIVDDDAHIAELIKLYLEKEEYKTAVASSGMMALKMFKEEAPSLVILDIHSIPSIIPTKSKKLMIDTNA